MDKKIGMFIGKFLPPHIGHTSQIDKCHKMVDELYVIIADSEKRTKEICLESGLPIISVDLRASWLKKHFKKYDNIKILTLAEGMLEAYPERFNEWKEKLISKKVFPEYEFVGFDRTSVDVSASMVREDLTKNLDKIIIEAKDYFREILK